MNIKFIMYEILNFNDMTESLPAFLTIVMMPFCYSIAQGIVFGFLSYTFLKVCTGQAKKVSVAVYVIALLFLIKMVIDALHLV